jgi:D-alanyl-D-alanine carboxypeptidase
MFLFFLLLGFSQVVNESKSIATSPLQAAFYNPSDIRQEINLLNLEDVSAEVILVKEFKGATLFQKNADQQKDIASLTKLMSSYLGYLLFQSETIFIFDRESVDQMGEVGNFYPGEKISRDNLLKASLVASSNDAIYLLAKTYGLEKFIELMNKKAEEFGMTQTKFIDPTGLKENLSTARDISKLLEKIYSQTPEIFSLTTLEKININGKILWTTNVLLPRYKSIIVGGKTGYKQHIGENLALILKLKNSPFISVVILNSKDRFADAEKIIKEIQRYYGN